MSLPGPPSIQLPLKFLLAGAPLPLWLAEMEATLGLLTKALR